MQLHTTRDEMIGEYMQQFEEERQLVALPDNYQLLSELLQVLQQRCLELVDQNS